MIELYSKTMSNSYPVITTSQMIAMSVTYRILCIVLFGVTMLIVGLPLAVTIAFYFLDRISRHHTILTVLMAVASSLYIESKIKTMAPTASQAKESLKKVNWWLPLVMLFPSILISSVVITPLESALGIRLLLTWTPPIFPVAVAARVALGAFLLGSSVCARYIGPPSIGKI